MLDYTERCQQSALVRFRQRRAFPVGSPGWKRAVKEARQFVRAYRFARCVETEERALENRARHYRETTRKMADRRARWRREIESELS